MSKNTLVAGLTLLSVLFTTATSTKAELAPYINNLTIKNIERSNTQERANPVEESTNDPERSNTPERPKRRRLATNSKRSMRFVKLGWEAQKEGEKDQALLYYYEAVKADQNNAYAFMAAGNLIGDTEDGITCMKAAAILFRAQGNQEGYNASTAWLEQRGIAQ